MNENLNTTIKKDKKADINISISQTDVSALFSSKKPEPLSISHYIDKKPRFYQINGVRKCNSYLQEGFKRILFIMPTGTGKTLASKLIALSLDIRKTLKIDKKKKVRILFICHKKRLLRQAEHEFADSPDIELITQSAFQHVPSSVIKAKWDITFIDEAHHEAMMSIQKLLDDLGDIPIIGFTANADRGDSLLVKFEKFIMPISKGEAIEYGYISEPGINTVVDTGKSDKTDLIISLFKKYNKHMGNGIVFFRTSKECERFYYWCCEQGITSMWLNSESSEDDLDDALEALSKGVIQFVINCKKVDEGIDALNCTDVILAKQFHSKAEKEQLIGRAIRPDSPCTVWELQNPYVDTVEAHQVVGSTRFRRLIYIENGKWEDDLLEGIDHEWGHGSELRFEYIKNNLGYDPRIEDEQHAFSRIKREDELKALNQSIPIEGVLVECDNSSGLNFKNKPKSEAPVKKKKKVRLTKLMIHDAADESMKSWVSNLKADSVELRKYALLLMKRGLL